MQSIGDKDAVNLALDLSKMSNKHFNRKLRLNTPDIVTMSPTALLTVHMDD